MSSVPLIPELNMLPAAPPTLPLPGANGRVRLLMGRRQFNRVAWPDHYRSQVARDVLGGVDSWLRPLEQLTIVGRLPGAGCGPGNGDGRHHDDSQEKKEDMGGDCFHRSLP